MTRGHEASMTARWVVAFSSVFPPMLGCGAGAPGPEQYELSGRVTFRGQPVPTGMVILTPDETRGNGGPGSVAPIADGRYATARGKGVVGGPYVVMIDGYDGKDSEVRGEGRNVLGNPLFSGLEVRIELPKEDSTYDFEVPVSQE